MFVILIERARQTRSRTGCHSRAPTAQRPGAADITAIWQCLRLSDMVSWPTWRAEFYVEHLNAAQHQELDIHVLDLVLAYRWYADQSGITPVRQPGRLR